MSGLKRTYQPTRAALLGLSAGTSLASVCIVGLILIRKAAPGLWAFAAIVVAFLICRILAGVFAHLVKTVPSGAGMFAFVSRAWGPAAGIVIIAPYVVLMVLLGALEALIVGNLLQPAFSGWPYSGASPAWLACVFLVASWLICISGMRLGLRIQAVATWLLITGMIAGGVWMLLHADVSGGASAIFLTAPPPLASFANAVGQAVFLFMGFELVCAQIETSDAQKISWALHGTVLLLAIVYGFVVLAGSAVTPPGPVADGIRIFLPAMASSSPGDMLPAIMIALCLLASITSLNGAFMGLSRLIAVMAGQRVLPQVLAAIHAPTLVPRRAVTLLLFACLLCVLIIDSFRLYQAVLFAAAVSAVTLYAIALLISGKAPFVTPGMPRRRRSTALRMLLVVVLLAIAAGVLIDSGPQFPAVASLLAVTYGAGLLASLRFGFRAQRKRTAASHAVPGGKNAS